MNILQVAQELGIKASELIPKAREAGMPQGTVTFSKVPAEIAAKLLGRDVAPDPPKVQEEPPEPAEGELPTLADMVDWVLAQIPDPNECPFCAFTAALEGGAKKHLRERHDVKVMAWFVNPTAGPDAYAQMMRVPEGKDDFPPPPEQDFGVEEDNIDPSFNHVPKSILRNLAASGAYGRWVSPRNVRRYWDIGYRFMDRPKDEGEDELHYQDSTADGRMRAREYVYMTLPKERRAQLDTLKRRSVEESEKKLPASIERKKTVLGDPGKQTYDWHHARGMRHENAMVLAKQAEKQGRPILTGPPPQNAFVHVQR